MTQQLRLEYTFGTGQRVMVGIYEFTEGVATSFRYLESFEQGSLPGFELAGFGEIPLEFPGSRCFPRQRRSEVLLESMGLTQETWSVYEELIRTRGGSCTDAWTFRVDVPRGITKYIK